MAIGDARPVQLRSGCGSGSWNCQTNIRVTAIDGSRRCCGGKVGQRASGGSNVGDAKWGCVFRSRKRKILRRRVSTGWPTRATHRNHVWTWDFIADATVRGGALRILTILDEHTRQCHVLWADRSLKAGDVLACLQKAIEEQGAPEYLRSDNGSEFIAKLVQPWLAENHIKTIYIEPGSPWQNGFVESFHGRFRDECLNREQLWTLTEARVVVGDYRQEYNHFRPHSRLGYDTPTAFAARTDHPCLRSGYALPPTGMDKPKRTSHHEPSPRTNTPSGPERRARSPRWTR